MHERQAAALHICMTDGNSGKRGREGISSKKNPGWFCNWCTFVVAGQCNPISLMSQLGFFSFLDLSRALWDVELGYALRNRLPLDVGCHFLLCLTTAASRFTTDWYPYGKLTRIHGNRDGRVRGREETEMHRWESPRLSFVDFSAHAYDDEDPWSIRCGNRLVSGSITVLSGGVLSL